MRDYCSMVFRPRMLYAFPCAMLPPCVLHEPAAGVGSGPPLACAGGAGAPADWSLLLPTVDEAPLPESHGWLVLEFMQVQLHTKKFSPSRTARKWKSMVLPATVRVWIPVAGGCWPADLRGAQAMPLGTASVVDLLAVCSWPVMVAHTIACDLSGLALPLELPEPRPVMKTIPKMLCRFPALVGIDTLARGGWSVGRGSADDHVPGGSKVFRMRGTDPASKMYYIMVSHLPRLFAAGLEAFPCDGDEALYRKVSAGECPKAEVQKCHERRSAAAKRGSVKRARGSRSGRRGTW